MILFHSHLNNSHTHFQTRILLTRRYVIPVVGTLLPMQVYFGKTITAIWITL